METNKEIEPIEQALEEVDDRAEKDEKFRRWKDALVEIAKHYRLDVSAQNVYITSLWNNDLGEDSVIQSMAKKAGLDARIVPIDSVQLSTWVLPLVVEFDDGQIAIVKNISKDKNEIIISLPEDKGLTTTLEANDFFTRGKRLFILRPITNVVDSRVDSYIKPVEKNWLWKIIFQDMRPYYYVILAAFLVNLLGLVGITYSMQTYDRIIPAQSFPTMWVIFCGVMIAFVLDFILRMLRYGILDVLGKRSDLRISDRVFGHAIRIKNENRPQSTGTFISQIRELEHVREMLTSSTVVSIVDLPFFFLFLFIIYLIGGIIFLVPLFGMIIMVLPGILSQKKLAQLAKAAMRESTLRSAMLVESIQGIDDIKVLQAEHRFQQQWFHYTCTTSKSNLELKHLTHKLSTWSYSVQSSVFVFVILCATPLAIKGEITTGAMVACSLLSSRMMAPISQLANILTRWQQAKVAINGINGLMKQPTDAPTDTKAVHRPYILGHYQYKNAMFSYGQHTKTQALFIENLEIKPGEKIAILGRNGSGKSTLLKTMVGLLHSNSGTVNLDGINMSNLDVADIRRDVSYLSQNSRLFHGSIRDNITLGAPLATDEQILKALEMTGIKQFIDSLQSGLDHMIYEGGLGLSGGQSQALLLSRTILRNSNVILLDEPTASLDDIAEREFVNNLKSWTENKTLIVATHRKKVLEIVDRIIIMSNKQVYADDTKEKILSSLS